MALKPISTGALPNLPSAGEATKKTETEPQSTVAKSDETRLSSAASGLASASNPATVDTAKVEALRSQIADGSYKPDSRAIANKLLQEAWQSKASA